MEIIAIAGPKTSGKTTLAKHLESRCPPTDMPFVARAPFAESLKSFCHTTLRVPREQLWGEAKGELTNYEDERGIVHTGRTLMQEVGQALRSVDPRIWIKIWYANFEHAPFVPIIDDLRFRNELEFVKSYESLTIRLTRCENTDQDPSERDLDDVPDSDFDVVVPWDVTEDETFEAVWPAAKKFLKKSRKIG